MICLFKTLFSARLKYLRSRKAAGGAASASAGISTTIGTTTRGSKHAEQLGHIGATAVFAFHILIGSAHRAKQIEATVAVFALVFINWHVISRKLSRNTCIVLQFIL